MELNRKQFEVKVAGRPLIFETSRLAEQATASVMAKYGDTAVLATVVMGSEDKDIDYLPLIVDYEEKFYAAGKIMGSRFMRREGKSSDEAVLSGRLIDRSIRPLFDQGIRRDIQIIITILSIDGENDADFTALMATSMALAISKIPWSGPVGGVRVAKIGSEIVINPINSQLTTPEKFIFDAFAAGPVGKINMIELEGIDADEGSAVEAFSIAQKEIDKLIDFQNEIVKKIGAEKEKVVSFNPYQNKELVDFVKNFLNGKVEGALGDLNSIKNDLIKSLAENNYSSADITSANQIFEETLDEIVHKNIIEKERRPDGRKLDEIRELYSEVRLFNRNHGSALFIRGGTQALAITTLAPPAGAQLVESIEFSGSKRFMLHYNFPPYSTGEIKNMRGPGRREIGHGALAEKAIKNLIPEKGEFPYAIRVVSEVMASNGSSSMATVCATSLSLMDAGVPIKKPAAGIAMGLMSDDKGNYKILTDIQGPEDHYGDMDFKIAGTRDGVTAVQLDVKNDGLDSKIIKETLAQARKARLEILDHLEKTLPKPQKNVSKYAPQVLTVKVSPDKIGMIIGGGGKTINGIIERTGATSIDIEDDGQVYISADDADKAANAKKIVEEIAKDYQVGDIIEGKVVKIMDFGAIVEFGYNQDGMIHVSELSDKYVESVRDVVKEGETVKAKIVKLENGKIGLSLKGMKK